MPKEEENIFQAAGKKPVKKKKKKKKAAPPLEKKKERPSFDDKEVDEAFNRMTQIRDEIVKKLEALYKEGGITPQDLSSYLDDQKNFPGKLFDSVQQQREKLLEDIWKGLGKKEKVKHIRKKAKKMGKKRKRKMIGGRKKWIPMR